MATQLDSVSYADDDFDIWKYDLTQNAFIVDGNKMHLIYGTTEIISLGIYGYFVITRNKSKFV